MIKAPKDFWTGVIYLGVGALGYYIGREYSFGSAGRMGPGYFPFAISCLLILFGIVTLVRSFLTEGEPIGSLAFKPIFLIIGAVLAFAYLLPRTGLIVAMLILVLMSAAASQNFRFEWRAVAGLAGLVAFCALVFVKGLGVPMPLVGSWLAPMMPSGIGG